MCTSVCYLHGHLRCTTSHRSQQQLEMVTKVVVVVVVLAVDMEGTLED